MISEMLGHESMRNALLAGGAIAMACGMVGHFLLLRAQVFAGDALSHVAFAGATGALAFGVDVRIGLFASVVGVALVLGAFGSAGRADDVVIGSVFVWVLGVGVLFLSLFTSNHATTNGNAGVNALFGSILGLDHERTISALVIAILIAGTVVVIARPLLFASIDESVAAARGVPVRALGFGFLVLVGLAAGEATQAVGALLLLGLLATPAAAAQNLTAKPHVALATSAAIGVVSVWTGLIVSYRVPNLPPSVAIVATLTLAFIASLYAQHRNVRDQRIADIGAASLDTRIDAT